MLTTLALIAGVIVLAIVVIAALAAGKPDDFALTRSAAISAPPERIYPFLEDFRNWRAWSPWETIDPALERQYGGAPKGVGATYAWQGKKAGEGRMEITDAAPPNRLGLRLEFVKPFKATNQVEFTLVPEGAATRVTWTMRGKQPFMGKVFGLFVDTDKMVGKDFEKGLANLKAAAEPETTPALG